MKVRIIFCTILTILSTGLAQAKENTKTTAPPHKNLPHIDLFAKATKNQAQTA